MAEAEHNPCINPDCLVCRPLTEWPYGGVHTKEEDDAWSAGEGKLATSPAERIRVERAALKAAERYVEHPTEDSFVVLEKAVKDVRNLND